MFRRANPRAGEALLHFLLTAPAAAAAAAAAGGLPAAATPSKGSAEYLQLFVGETQVRWPHHLADHRDAP
eukprot:SM000098S25094  [mRNA]  locus=s98:180455:180664:- [translate_table: standard]